MTSHEFSSDASQEGWRQIFGAWPAELPRRGLVITSFGEQIPFDAFMLSGGFVLLQRPTPDTLGARTVILPMANVVGLKITDVMKPKAFQAMGFVSATPAK